MVGDHPINQLSEEREASLGEIPAVVAIFQMNESEKSRAAEHSVNQLIVALFATLMPGIHSLTINLEDFKSGHKVEEVNRSKGY